jgi:DNA polymerase III epsilon subunit-like protein
MKRCISGIALVHILFLGLPSGVDAAPGGLQVQAYRHANRHVNRRAGQLWRTIRARTGKVRPANKLQLKGFLEGNLPHLQAPEPVSFSKNLLKKGLVDASYQRTHPMYQRLAASNWYANEPQIARLQRLANQLRANRKLPRSTPIAEVEFLSFDLEATGGRKGSFDKKKRQFRAGQDEIIQFGYTVVRDGRVIEQGTMDVNPSLFVPGPILRLTGLTMERLRAAKPLEAHAERILELMQGRVLVGHDAIKNDWAWMQSNFARLGVHLPGPTGLIADTRLMSFTVDPKGLGLRPMVERFGITVDSAGRFHDAGVDALATAKVMGEVARNNGVQTLGQLMQLNETGRAIRAREAQRVNAQNVSPLPPRN